MHEVRPAMLVRESNMQLLMYSLDTRVSYSTYLLIFKSQKGSIEALNFLVITSSITLYISFIIGFIINQKKVNCYWGCNYCIVLEESSVICTWSSIIVYSMQRKDCV